MLKQKKQPPPKKNKPVTPSKKQTNQTNILYIFLGGGNIMHQFNLSVCFTRTNYLKVSDSAVACSQERCCFIYYLSLCSSLEKKQPLLQSNLSHIEQNSTPLEQSGNTKIICLLSF